MSEQLGALLGNPDVADDPWLQLQLVHILAQTWDGLTTLQQDTYLKAAIQTISRCNRAADHETAVAIFHRLRKLGEGDLLDALRYNEGALAKYTLRDHERCYPEASPAANSWMGRYLWWARPGNCPLAYHAWACISVLGTVAQRRVFTPAARRIFLNMYVMLGGIQGTGKGQALDAALKMFNEINRQVDEKDWDEDRKVQSRLNILPGDVTGEALITELRDRVSPLRGGEIPDPVEDEEGNHQGIRVRLDGARPQIADATGIIPLDEAATFFGKDAWGVARKAAMVTEMKEADRYRKRTKRSGLEELENLSLGMLACCAPAWMNGAVEMSTISGGLMDRTMWIHREPDFDRRLEMNILTAPCRDPLYLQTLAYWCVERILSLPMKMPAKISPEAERVSTEYYRKLVELERDEYELFGADMRMTTANRAHWASIQVATLLALAEDEFPPLVVLPEHMEAAQAWVDTENQSMAEFLEQAEHSVDLRVGKMMLRYLGQCGGCVKRGQFNRQFAKHGTARELEMHVKNLVAQDLAEMVTKGRDVYYRLKDHECGFCS